MMSGQEAQAMAAAREIEKAISDDAMREDLDLQGAATATVFTLVRFGHWKEILALPAPQNDLPYVEGMWYYSRGLAFTRLAQFLDVPPEQAELEEATARVRPDQTVLGTTNARKQLEIAILVLDAEIEHMRAHRESSLKQIREAVRLEDGLGSAKPAAFYVPTRQVYGAILLWNDRPREAEQAFREDLERNPENGWALLGLAQSLQAQKRTQEATEVKARAQRAHAQADVRPPTSVF
jgi:tetratricopeptide (TPR) repeat protein